MPATLAFYHLPLLSITLLQDTLFSDFNDLGMMLLGGFALAVLVAIVYTFIKLRLRDKNPPTEFISINSLRHPDASSKADPE